MSQKINHFINTHFVGLFGLLMFFFYLIFNLLPTFVQRLAKYDFPHIDAVFIVLGTGLIIYDFIPKQVDYKASQFKNWLNRVIDRLPPKSTLVILFALTAIGFYLRFSNLGDRSFFYDEAITSYASIGLLRHGTPVLPSGVVYNRALLNTYLIALSFKTFGVSEFSARIVSVIFGTLSIPLVYLMGKELGKRTGLIAALIITFSAFEIFYAQQARMYAQFQFFYLLTAYLLYISLKKDNSKLVLLSVVPFIFAWYSHQLSLLFIPTAMVCILSYKRREYSKNIYFLYAIIGLMGLAFVYVIVTSKTPLDYMPSLTEVPASLQHTCLHYVFAHPFTTLFFLVSISSTISIILWEFGVYHDKTYLYFILNFFIPFIFLSLYPWKRDRYAFFIFPFLAILASHAIDFYALRNGLNYVTCDLLSNKFKLSSKLLTNIKNSIIISLILLLSLQVSTDIYLNFQESTYDDWKKAGGFVKGHLDDDDKVATTAPLLALYYVERVDYMLSQDEFGAAVDWYTGISILDNYDLFMQTVNTEKGWVITDQYRLDFCRPNPKIREYIRNNMTYYPEESDERMEVYSWGNVSSDKK